MTIDSKLEAKFGFGGKIVESGKSSFPSLLAQSVLSIQFRQVALKAKESSALLATQLHRYGINWMLKK